ncbi:MAG: hypothetical protein Q8S94_00170 [Pseudohongiella sp.]|nr:hypothetical protein [Pseudohongiella sp.]
MTIKSKMQLLAQSSFDLIAYFFTLGAGYFHESLAFPDFDTALQTELVAALHITKPIYFDQLLHTKLTAEVI